ncbi:HU family DNA-binding protein [Parachitinimonas caeni]|uniref:Viral histone-like protein n=1 Tax=Parachitinimonas caeni TaxID=3031301 RepID=A0ABT7DWR1_9NEIS|nr:HU family DNA-binding protein [Parachitinimonas caeni]MDK2124466.1 HU family DNA-binding protein [Parachitinimonas caeni]
MNKQELIREITEVCSDSGLDQGDIETMLDGLAKVATKRLAARQDVSLPGLGKLRASLRAARPGRNPKTGEAIQIPAMTSVRFAPSKTLKQALNS